MTRDISPLEKRRLKKLVQLQAKGVDPYPHRIERTHTTAEAIDAFEILENTSDEPSLSASLVGRIRSIRPMGKITFAHIEDGYGSIQLFFRANDIGKDALDDFNRLYDLGDFIQADGEVFRTRAGEVTLRVNAFQVISKALSPLPASKEQVIDGEVVQYGAFSDPETRYRQRYADLAVNPEVRKIFKARARIIRALQEFLDSRDFIEVETPILQPIYGGAAARPFITHHNQLKQDLYLRISFELYLKRLLVGGLERVYEIGRDFRNEGVDRTHNPEFTQIEFYMAYADYNQIMELTEEMIGFVAQEVAGTKKISFGENEIDLEPPWKRILLRDALKEQTGIDIQEHQNAESLASAMRTHGMDPEPTSTRGKLIDSLISTHLEPNLIQPTFIYDYPREISPLAKTIPGDPQTVERFEGFVAGMELCNAFTELNDPQDQESRFVEMGKEYSPDDEERHPMDDDYLRAMRYGMPPNGGFGMGVDRLTMLLTNSPNIREVILFPHLRQRDTD